MEPPVAQVNQEAYNAGNLKLQALQCNLKEAYI